MNFASCSALGYWPRLMRHAVAVLLSSFLLFTAACSDDDDTPPPAATPDTVTFAQAGLYPEGVQYSASTNSYFVSSLTRGALGQVRDDGSYSVFADDARLVSTMGLHLDAGRNRLLAAVADPGANPIRSTPATAGQLAALAVLDATTGRLNSFVDLGALRPGQRHFANDVAVDAQGNAYVTDSFSPLIYKVDAQGTATVLLENAAWAAPAGAFGLNGIVYHPDGYLLVAHSAQGAVYKVPLSNPAQFTRLSSAQSLAGVDGLLLLDNRTLLAASNSQRTVYRLSSADGFGTASAEGSFVTGAVFPTTLTRRGSDTYVLYSYLDVLLSGRPPVAEYSINKVRF